MKRRLFFRTGAGATLLAAIAAAVFLSLAGTRCARPDRALERERAALQLLKAEYLACDQAASQSRLSPGAAYCSRVAEELLARAFEGDFERLIAWWRSEKQAQAKR